MDNKKTFEIILIKKIPYLTTGLLILFFLSFCGFAFFSDILSSQNASPETKTFYLINTSTIRLPYYYVLTFVVTFLLYKIAILKRKGLVIFNSDSFELLLKKEQQIIPFESVRRVYCNDSEDKKELPNKKFTMTIETWKNKKILVRLQKTSDIKPFIDKLLSYDNLKIEHFSLTTLD